MKTNLRFAAWLGAILLALGSFGASYGWIEHTIDADFVRARDSQAIDIDGDGDLDVVAAACNHDTDQSDVNWYEQWDNHGNPNFIEHNIDKDNSMTRNVFAIDVDGDDDVDVLATCTTYDIICWYENNGTGYFSAKHIITDKFDFAWDVYGADMDGDGDVDVLGTANNGNEVAMWENDGSENFTKTFSSNLYDACSVVAADINLDGNLDILVTGRDGDKVAWFRQDYGEFTEEEIDYDINGPNAAIAEDLDLDHDIDVITAAYDGGEIAWYRNNGNQVTEKNTIDDNVYRAFDVDAEDMYGDGDVEIPAAIHGDDEIVIYSIEGDREVVGFHDGASSISAIDIDDDGDIDLLSTAEMDDMVTWWENETDPEVTTTTSCLTPVVHPGGVLLYEVTITNRTDQVQYFQFWADVILPIGTVFPIIGTPRPPYPFPLMPGQEMTVPAQAYVPPTAPLGGYSYWGYLGIFPTVDWTSVFTFKIE